MPTPATSSGNPTPVPVATPSDAPTPITTARRSTPFGEGTTSARYDEVASAIAAYEFNGELSSAAITEIITLYFSGTPLQPEVMLEVIP